MENPIPTIIPQNRAAKRHVKAPTRWSGRPRQNVSLRSTGRALRQSIEQLVENERARTVKQVLAQTAKRPPRRYSHHLMVATGLGCAAMGAGALLSFSLTAFMSRQSASVTTGWALLGAAGVVLTYTLLRPRLIAISRTVASRMYSVLRHVSAAMGQSGWSRAVERLWARLKSTELRVARSLLLARARNR